MRVRLLLVAVTLFPVAARPDGATEARLRDALRAATAQVHALEDERAAGKAREEALQKEVDRLRAQAQAHGAEGAKASQREVADLRRRLTERAEAADRSSQELARCQAAEREHADVSRVKDDERARAASDAATCRDRLAAAEVKNAKLFRAGKDIIDWLNGIGVAGALATREPFLGLKRVELENAAQDHEDRLLESRMVPSPPASATP
jgi:hypothetical protein